MAFNSNENHFQSLPNELYCSILDYLTANELSVASQLNKRFNAVIQSKTIWKNKKRAEITLKSEEQTRKCFEFFEDKDQFSCLQIKIYFNLSSDALKGFRQLISRQKVLRNLEVIEENSYRNRRLINIELPNSVSSLTIKKSLITFKNLTGIKRINFIDVNRIPDYVLQCENLQHCNIKNSNFDLSTNNRTLSLFQISIEDCKAIERFTLQNEHKTVTLRGSVMPIEHLSLLQFNLLLKRLIIQPDRIGIKICTALFMLMLVSYSL